MKQRQKSNINSILSLICVNQKVIIIRENGLEFLDTFSISIKLIMEIRILDIPSVIIFCCKTDGFKLFI